MSVHLSNFDIFLWVATGAVLGLCIYLMGFFMGEAVTKGKLRSTRGQMEIDDIFEKEVKVKDVKHETNTSEKN